MNYDFYKVLRMTIRDSYVSVHNTPDGTAYYIADDTNPDLDASVMILSTRYANNGTNGMFAEYSLMIDDELVACVNKPIINLNTKQPHQLPRGQKTNLAQMEKLVRMCSDKVISQEIEARKNNMIKAVLATANGIVHN